MNRKIVFARVSIVVLAAAFSGSNATYAGFRLIDSANPPTAPSAVAPAGPVTTTVNHDADIDRLLADVQRLAAQLAETQKNLERAKRDMVISSVAQQSLESNLDAIAVSFSFGSSNFTPNAGVRSELLNSAFKSSHITITGFSDNIGGPAGNLKIAQRRADSAKTYLQINGVTPSKITADAKLEHYIATNDTSIGRRANRRVEFTFAK